MSVKSILNTSFFLILFIAGCEGRPKDDNIDVLEVTLESASVKDKLRDILDIYLKEVKCTECIHEIFFDKVMYNTSILTIRSMVYSKEYLLKNKPLMKMMHRNTEFYIYSGIEDYFTGVYRFKEDSRDKKEMYNVYWTVIDSAGTFNIIKYGPLPFTPIPGVSVCPVR